MVGASTLRPGVTIRRTGATDSKPQTVLILLAAILLLPLEAAVRRREPRRVGDDAAGFLYAEVPTGWLGRMSARYAWFMPLAIIRKSVKDLTLSEAAIPSKARLGSGMTLKCSDR